MLLITVEETIATGTQHADSYVERTTKRHFLTGMSLENFLILYQDDLRREMAESDKVLWFSILSVAPTNFTHEEIRLFLQEQNVPPFNISLAYL